MAREENSDANKVCKNSRQQFEELWKNKIFKAEFSSSSMTQSKSVCTLSVLLNSGSMQT